MPALRDSARDVVAGLRGGVVGDGGEDEVQEATREYFFEHAAFAVAEFLADATQQCDALVRGSSVGVDGRARRGRAKAEVEVEARFVLFPSHFFCTRIVCEEVFFSSSRLCCTRN